VNGAQQESIVTESIHSIVQRVTIVLLKLQMVSLVLVMVLNSLVQLVLSEQAQVDKSKKIALLVLPEIIALKDQLEKFQLHQEQPFQGLEPPTGKTTCVQRELIKANLVKLLVFLAPT